jgi:WD40 repeat protein
MKATRSIMSRLTYTNDALGEFGDSLSTENARLLEQVCDRFERAFRNDNRLRIEDLLHGLPPTMQGIAQAELVYLEIYYRRRAGESPTADEYRARFSNIEPTRLAEAIEEPQQSDTLRGSKITDANDPPPCPEGTRIGYIGDYEILTEIARGGMGVVYKARQISLDRIVALKMVRGGELATPDAVWRFLKEAEAAATLDHPNIVSIHEVGEHVGQHYYVMRFVEGGSLASRMKEYAVSAGTDKADIKKRLVRAAELTAKVARAVHHANQRGILHRDLKPANIIMDSSGDPHVTDFGLSRRLGDENSHTPTGLTIGTPSYMAPEQVRSDMDVTIQADVYGLGAILYELLTGAPPFKGCNAMETLLLVRDQEPVRPSAVCPKIHRDLETICLKCLQKDPRRRYATADSLADDLRRFLAGEPISARPASSLDRGLKWARRHPAIAALAAAVILVTVTGMAGVTWSWQKAETALGQKEQARREEVKARADERQSHTLANAQRERAETTLYFQSIGLAHRDWQAGKVTSAEDILDRCSTESRGWEWYYLKRLCHPEIMKFGSHSSAVAAVAYSPDGSRLGTASGSWGRKSASEIRIWDAATGKETAVCNGHTEAVRSIAYSPDGKRLVSGGWDGSVRIWDAATGVQLHELHNHENIVHAVAFSADGRYIASGSTDQSVILWDANTGACVYRFAGLNQTIHCVAFSPDSQRLAAAGYGGIIQVWRVDSHKELHRRSDLKDIRALAFSPDGKRLATGGYDRVVTVWNLTSMTPAVTFAGHTGPINAIAYSPDGLQVASADTGGDVKVWDTRHGRALVNVRGHTGGINGLAFHPDASQLAYGGEDRTARIWDLTRDPESRSAGDRFSMTKSLVFNENNNRLLGISGASWFARDRKLMMTNLDSGSHQIYGDPQIASTTYSALAYCPSGKIYLLGCENGDLRLGYGENAPALRGHIGTIHSIGLRSDELEAATAGSDGTVRLWDLTLRAELQTLRGHAGKVNWVVYHPNGKLLASAGADRTVRIWNAQSGEQVAVLKGHDGPVSAVAFSRDGKTLASAGEDQVAMIWDVDALQTNGSDALPRLTLHGHAGAVTCLAFTSDNRRLITSSADWTLILWDVATGHRALTLKDPSGGIQAVTLSPDDRYLVSATSGLRIWEGGVAPDPAAVARKPSESDAFQWRLSQIQRAFLHRNWQAIVFQASHHLQSFPDQTMWYYQRGGAYAELANWSEAVNDFRTMLEICHRKPVPQGLRRAEPAFWHYLALAHCGAGEEKAYRLSLNEMYQRFAKTESSGVACLLLFTCLPALDSIQDRDSLLRLGKLAQRTSYNARLYPAALCRAADYKGSLRAFNEGGWELRAWDLLFMAIAHEGLGQADEARACLEKARGWIENADKMEVEGCERVWNNWLERVQVTRLRQEVEALLPNKPR